MSDLATTSAPEDRPEIFVLRDKHGAAVAWNVSAIHAWLCEELRASGRGPNVRFDVMKLFNTGGCRHVSKRRALAPEMDLRWPLIAIQTNGGVLLIDGWHRVYKAKKRGVAQLRGYVLLPEEERRFRIDPSALR